MMPPAPVVVPTEAPPEPVPAGSPPVIVPLVVPLVVPALVPPPVRELEDPSLAAHAPMRTEAKAKQKNAVGEARLKLMIFLLAIRRTSMGSAFTLVACALRIETCEDRVQAL
jgi:hypothetical protein